MRNASEAGAVFRHLLMHLPEQYMQVPQRNADAEQLVPDIVDILIYTVYDHI